MRFIQKFVFFVCLVFGSVSQAEVYDVSTTPELREALASAAEAGGDNTIRLAAGTYSTQDDGEGTFEFVSNKAGSLAIQGSTDVDSTLDGSSVDQVVFIFNPSGLMEEVELSNVHVTNGRDTAIKIEAKNSQVRIIDSVFTSNEGDRGGALNLQGERQNFDSLSIINSTFRQNQGAYGGAIRIYRANTEIQDSVFEQNTSPPSPGTFQGQGGAIQMLYGSLVLRDSHFAQNTGVYAGAIYLDYEDSSEIHNTRFTGNSGQYVIRGGRNPRVSVFNSEFQDNTENSYRVASLASVVNSRFSNNAPLRAWGNSTKVSNNIFDNTSVIAEDDPVFVNNIFVNNEVDFEGSGPIFIEAHNNYLDENTQADGIYLEGDGNIFEGVNLGFVNADEGDYRLTSSSGLIDAGTTDPDLAYITDYDYTGTTARVIGASIDIGPYEYDGEAPSDSDSDGLNDNIDNCPSIANEDQADFDSDGEGDACDSDDDNDGTNDEDDAFPFDDSESLDTDGDGIGNNEDYDDDADGILDSFDNAPLVVNAIVVDSDNDGVVDSVDAYPNDPTKQYSGSGDLDGDGYSNDEEVDYCSNPFDKNSQPDAGGLSTPMIHLLTEQ